MTPVLVADIGGTTTRFALADEGGTPRDIRVTVNDPAPSLEAAIERYLLDTGARPRAAVLAVAGPVGGDEIAMTNRPWRFRLAALRDRFGFADMRALNDFEALAWAIADLRDCETRPIGRNAPGVAGVRVVLGPGTGLGVAGLVPLRPHGWHVVASEGGHMSFGPNCADEEPIFAQVRGEHGISSAETFLSGDGMKRLYRALHPDAAPVVSEDIVARAREGDPAARQTTALFVRLLGRFAGDAAMMFKATGGVFIAGGVAMGLGPLLDDATFRAAFEAHPPYQKLLSAIPTSVVACRQPGLVGCAAFVEQMLRTGARQDIIVG